MHICDVYVHDYEINFSSYNIENNNWMIKATGNTEK